MPGAQVFYATIPLSGTVSGTFNVVRTVRAGVWFPTVTSAAFFVQGSPDVTSANFVRIQNAAGSGAYTLAAGVGSLAFTLQDPVIPFPYLRFESGVAQAAVRSLAVVAKF